MADMRVGRKIGSTEVKISVEMLVRMRARVMELGPFKTNEAAANALYGEFKELSFSSVEEYLGVVIKASDYRFSLMASRTISIGTLKELCQGEFDEATRDTLAQIVVERNMTPSQVMKVKKLVKDSKGRMALAEAVLRATKQIPLHSKHDDVKESIKTFGKTIDDLVDASTKFMTKLQMAIDIIPGSAVENGESYMSVYEKIVTFENTLDSSLRFVSERKKRFFEALRSHIITEASMHQKRIEGGK